MKATLDFKNPCYRTRHFAERADQRKLPVDVEQFVATWGTRFRVRDCFCVFVVRENLPPQIRKSPIVDRAKGWLMIVAHDGALVTCFFNEQTCKRIRRAA